VEAIKAGGVVDSGSQDLHVRTRKDLDNVRFTTLGKYDGLTYDRSVFDAQVEEFMELGMGAAYYAWVGVVALVLYRKPAFSLCTLLVCLRCVGSPGECCER
jgi:hypothetical protein